MRWRRLPLLAAMLPFTLATGAMPPALAQDRAEPLETEPRGDAPEWLTWCVRTEGGTTLADAQCYVRHREALVAAQALLVDRIGAQLSRQGPDGTDYPGAMSALESAQSHWQAYVRADCDVVADVFGYGTALGLAGEECIIDHYLERNQVLRDLEEGYLAP